MLKTIAEETWFYILEHDDETGDYILDVACGTVAIYTIKFKLNEGEINNYLTDPSSIRVLAYRVCDYPKEYLDRRV
ncbi:MAG: hypothetical protein WBC19_04395 [Pyrinomonadaceae bacterium]|nr:hypothetical protein [Chloracidobacterium sp.]